jgi:catechol 2,3-dioxygenase
MGAMSKFIGVRHVGLEARNLAALTTFYRDVMGMTVVRETPTDSPFGAAVFLVSQPGSEEDHDLVLFSNPTLAHTAYAVASLAELKASYREMKERGVPIKYALNHGNQLSFYIEDPEGHFIEIYWLINARFPAIAADSIDLDRPEAELQREVESLASRLGLPSLLASG